MHRVLVVENDARMRDVLARGLRAHDFDVVTAVDGASALRSVTPVPDAIVLDSELPDSDGRDVCQALRSQGVDAPVVFLTERNDLSDRLAAFAAGGDDVLGKPYAFAELLARLEALVRRHVRRGLDSAPALRMDPLMHAVRYGTARVELSPTEFRLLARLVAESGAVVRRRQLRDAGWPVDGIVADNTLDQYITKLRRKLERVEAPHRLRAIRGVGYQLVEPELAAG